MTVEWDSVLRAAWIELSAHPPQAREYRTRPLPGSLALDAYVALRAVDNGPCLLIRGEAPTEMLFELGGMRLAADHDERGPMLVLTLEDSSRGDLFTTLCADALAAVGADGATGRERFLERLGAWRRFLRERRTGLTREEAIGLTGELLVLELLLHENCDLLEAWKAPQDGLHDFDRGGHAIEVKSSLGPASQVRISNLDQLDTMGTRRLDLIHVRLIEDPNGRTLADVSLAVEALLPDESSRRAFGNALLLMGLMPEDEARTRFKISPRAIEAYSVDEAFPRLLRSAVPAAITDATYALELRSIASHAIDATTVCIDFAGPVT